MRSACLLFLLPIVTALADMAPMRQVPLRNVADYWKNQGPAGNLSPEHSRAALLARVAAETGAAETASVVYTENEKEAISRVDAAAIQRAMQKHLAENDWTELTRLRRKMVKKNRGVLKDVFGERSYLWAWCEYQIGDRAASKGILAPLYTAEVDRVMRLKQVFYRLGEGPLDAAEAYLRALRSVSDAGEIADYEEQMRKMKAHVSNLPQSQIMT